MDIFSPTPPPPPIVESPTVTSDPALATSPRPPSKFGFFRGKWGKLLLLFLVVLIPVSVFIVINYKNVFRNKANQNEHNECNNNTCETVSGGGPNECSNPGGCCGNPGQCGGQTACESDSDCNGAHCNRSTGRCESRTPPPPPPPGPTTCTVNSCPPGQYCNGTSCQTKIPSDGVACCDGSCKDAGQTCRINNGACVSGMSCGAVVCKNDGAGCSSNNECCSGGCDQTGKCFGGTPGATHFECLNNSCKSQPGQGLNDCGAENASCVSTRTATSICQIHGGTAGATCGVGGASCSISSVTYCCYGDANATSRDGSCYLGSTGKVTCGGGSINNNSTVAITIQHYTRNSGGCPSTIPAGNSSLGAGQSVSAGNCEQIDAPGYCGQCNPGVCGGTTPPPPGATPPPPPPGSSSPSCTGLALKPTGTVITSTGETRTFTVTAIGGTPPYSATWVTNNGATIAAGTPTTTATWQGPATLPTVATTWTITPTVKDSTNTILPASAACVQTLSFAPGGTTPPPPPPPPPPGVTPPPPPPGTPSNMVCQNYACVAVSGSGSNQCATNESCAPPKSGNSWPTIVGAGAGLLLTIVGAILLL